MSRYFTEENDGGMSAEVFTISKDDTNHASKIRSINNNLAILQNIDKL